jgi:hypothetical protein
MVSDEFWGPATTDEMQELGFEGSDPMTSEEDWNTVEAACKDGVDLMPHRRRIQAIIHDLRLASHLVDALSEMALLPAHKKLLAEERGAQTQPGNPQA